MENSWTPEQVEAHLVLWAQAWIRTPDPEQRFLRSKGPSWAAMIVKDQQEVFADAVANGGRFEDMPEPRLGNTSADIAMRDRVGEWLKFLTSVRQQKIVAYAAFSLTRRNKNVDWRFVSRMAGTTLHYRSMSRIFNDGLSKIAGNLNAQNL